MAEYLFYSKKPLDFPLHESIDVVSTLPDSSASYLVANIPTDAAEIIAPEIDWYVCHTRDDLADRIVNVSTLYEARTIGFDGAQHFDYTQSVGSRLLIVSDINRRDLATQMGEEGFTAIWIDSALITDVTGHIGELEVTVRGSEGSDQLQTDQIIWFGAPDFALRQSGVYDANQLGETEALEKARSHLGIYHYKNFIGYDSTVCQYHERLTDVCGKCVEVCPTTAIIKVEEERHLAFDPVNCEGCGGCVGVCPSGALDYTQMPMETWDELAELYRDRIPLIVPEQLVLSDINVSLAPHVLPLAIPGQKFLSEVHLLTLLQKSGGPILFYTHQLGKGTGDAITLLNDIFERAYHKQAVYLCQTPQELLSAMERAVSISECRFWMKTPRMKKREVFTHRLAHLVGDRDLGIITTGEHIHYGTVTVNEDACTLCLACVGACNAGALTAHPEDNTLRFNASMCTDCGYCEYICPEKDCITVHHDELHLEPSYFKQVVLAKDELFKCVECGKEFATVKAIQKIADMMTPRFGDDAARIHALYCCPDCKPKVMLRDHLQAKNSTFSGASHG